MPITVEIISEASEKLINMVFDYFHKIDERFSTYKPNSEISKVNNGLAKNKWSKEMKTVFTLCKDTKDITKGYFDIKNGNIFDPSGLVKGWSINNAAELLKSEGIKNFYIEAGGDIQVYGRTLEGKAWTIGIRNPFNIEEIIKVVELEDQAIATSGTYIRGQHIYNPHSSDKEITDVKSLSVIASNIYEADRFATAAFAMGKDGISFIEEMPGLEGYMVDRDKIATFTSGFERYAVNNA